MISVWPTVWGSNKLSTSTAILLFIQRPVLNEYSYIIDRLANLIFSPRSYYRFSVTSEGTGIIILHV